MTRVFLALALLAGCGEHGSTPVDAAIDVVRLDAGVGTFTVTPTAIDFGTGGGGTPALVTVRSTFAGPTGALAVSLTGADRAAFEISSDTCSGKPLADGGTCTVEVRTSCNDPGTNNAVLDFHAFPGIEMKSVTLTAFVFAKSCTWALIVSGSGGPFGDQVVATTSAKRQWTFQNFGGLTSPPLTPVLEGMAPGEFAVAASTCTGTALKPGDTCTVDVAFTPLSPGAKQALLRLDPGSTTAGLSGAGVAAASAPL